MNCLYLIVLILAACAPKDLGQRLGSFPTKSAVVLSRNRPHLFPNGIYSHRITITDPQGKESEFRGFLRLNEHEIHAVGVTKMGTTLFKLNHNLIAKRITYRFYYPLPRKFKKRFVSIYSTMKKIFLLPLKNDVSEKNGTIHFNVAGLPSRYVDHKKGIEVRVGHYDQNLIPLALNMEYKNFSVWIDLDEYQLGDSQDY